MTKAIRDTAQARASLLAATKEAGSRGLPLKDALTKACGRTPLGSDYWLAIQLRREGQIVAFEDADGHSKRIVHKDYANGRNESLAPTPNIEVKPRRTRKRRHAPSAAILLTIQYGNHESVTLSWEQARQIYRHLAGMFGDSK